MNISELQGINPIIEIKKENGDVSHMQYDGEFSGMHCFHGVDVEQYNPFMSGIKMKFTTEELNSRDDISLYGQTEEDVERREADKMEAFYSVSHLMS